MTQKHMSRRVFHRVHPPMGPCSLGTQAAFAIGALDDPETRVSTRVSPSTPPQWVPAHSGHGSPSQLGHPMTQKHAPGTCLNLGPTMHKAALPLVCGGFVACLGGPIGIWGYAGYLWIGGAIPWVRFTGGLRGVNRHKAALPLVCGGLAMCLGAPSGLATGNCLPWLCGARFHFLD